MEAVQEPPDDNAKNTRKDVWVWIFRTIIPVVIAGIAAFIGGRVTLHREMVEAEAKRVAEVAQAKAEIFVQLGENRAIIHAAEKRIDVHRTEIDLVNEKMANYDDRISQIERYERDMKVQFLESMDMEMDKLLALKLGEMKMTK
jgi:hypothetical protein